MNDEYTWDKNIVLSTNGINLIKHLLKEYSPEPWEAQLRQKLMEELEKF